MSEQVVGVLISDGRYTILLRPPVRASDGHGFAQRIDVVAPPFRGSIDASSYEGPRTLRSFHEQLVELHQTLNGEARLGYTYDRMKLSLKGDGLGHVAVRTEVLAGDYMDVRLSFTFGIDQTQLPAIIAAVEQHFLKNESSGE